MGSQRLLHLTLFQDLVPSVGLEPTMFLIPPYKSGAVATEPQRQNKNSNGLFKMLSIHQWGFEPPISGLNTGVLPLN